MFKKIIYYIEISLLVISFLFSSSIPLVDYIGDSWSSDLDIYSKLLFIFMYLIIFIFIGFFMGIIGIIVYSLFRTVLGFIAPIIYMAAIQENSIFNGLYLDFNPMILVLSILIMILNFLSYFYGSLPLKIIWSNMD